MAYQWSFGDGGTSNAVVAQYAYGQAGNFTVTLTIVDQTGAKNTASQSITIAAAPSQPPTASLTGPTQAMVNEPVTFDASASVAGSSPTACAARKIRSVWCSLTPVKDCGTNLTG